MFRFPLFPRLPLFYLITSAVYISSFAHLLMIQILTTLKRNLDIPVTCKIRLLKTPPETVELARRIEKIGVSALAVHGRYVYLNCVAYLFQMCGFTFKLHLTCCSFHLFSEYWTFTFSLDFVWFLLSVSLKHNIAEKFRIGQGILLSGMRLLMLLRHYQFP